MATDLLKRIATKKAEIVLASIVPLAGLMDAIADVVEWLL